MYTSKGVSADMTLVLQPSCTRQQAHSGEWWSGSCAISIQNTRSAYTFFAVRIPGNSWSTSAQITDTQKLSSTTRRRADLDPGKYHGVSAFSWARVASPEGSTSEADHLLGSEWSKCSRCPTSRLDPSGDATLAHEKALTPWYLPPLP